MKNIILILLLVLISFPSFAKDTKEDADGDISIEDTGVDAPEGYLEFSSEAEAIAKMEVIDKGLGYLIQDPTTLEWYRPFATQTAYGIIKHKDQDKWAIEVKNVYGTKHKKKNDKIITKAEKERFKTKQNLIDEGYFEETDEP